MLRVTRKDKVLSALTEARRLGFIVVDHYDGLHRRRYPCDQGWVDGHVLCDPLIGGSEGLRRLRELRADGFPILMRRHPDPNRADHQYLLSWESIDVDGNLKLR